MTQSATSPPLASRPTYTNRLGRKLRILVVDDSIVIRRIMSQVLNEDPAFEVVGHAGNGVLALQRVAELNPDVITLDIEMPEMDGLTTVRRLREADCKACIIMCSTLTSRGASATVDALIFGANDYVTKPSNNGPMDPGLNMLRDELIPKIKEFFAVKRTVGAPHSGPVSSVSASRVAPHLPAAPLFTLPAARKIVAVGVSTGGPTALMEILPLFPASFPLPVVIVQHMPAAFTKLLADRLSAQSPFEVAEATDGMRLQPGRVILAP
jgi:two-component system, chemotaxis family, protein-glutamate methylesterase/glutaminase